MLGNFLSHLYFACHSTFGWFAYNAVHATTLWQTKRATPCSKTFSRSYQNSFAQFCCCKFNLEQKRVLSFVLIPLVCKFVCHHSACPVSFQCFCHPFFLSFTSIVWIWLFFTPAHLQRALFLLFGLICFKFVIDNKLSFCSNQAYSPRNQPVQLSCKSAKLPSSKRFPPSFQFEADFSRMWILYLPLFFCFLIKFRKNATKRLRDRVECLDDRLYFVFVMKLNSKVIFDVEEVFHSNIHKLFVYFTLCTCLFV